MADTPRKPLLSFSHTPHGALRPTMRNALRTWLAVLLLLGSLVEPATAAVAGVDGSTSVREQMIQRCRTNWQPSCVELGVPNPQETPGAVECALAWRRGCPGESEAAQGLIQSGPSGLTFPTPFQFAVTGFIQSGWPIVVSYRVPPGASATLRITPQFGGGHPFDVVLPQSPDGGVQYHRLVAEVPGSEKRVLIANFVITARSYSPSERRSIDAPVQILGFGAGPRAVGSVAIDHIRYDPPIIRRPLDRSTIKLTYDYLLKNDWDRVAEDLWRNCAGIGPFCNFRHPRRPYRPSAQGPQQWQWLVNRATKVGQYQLVVRAWPTCGALADPAAYRQCGDEADWVIGSAGPIFIQ